MDRENNYTLELIDLTDDTQVNAAGDITNLLRPPVGFVYELVVILIDIPDPIGSGAGVHVLKIMPTNRVDDDLRWVSISSNFGTDIQIRNYVFGGTTKFPSSSTTQGFVLMNMQASYDQPVDIFYNNATDVNQTGTRKMEFLVRKYREAI